MWLLLFNQASYNWAMPHLEVAVHADRHPVGQHFLHNGLSAAQHQFGVLGSRSINQVHQQILHDTGVVLQLSMKSDGEQRRQAASKGWENRLAEETDERKQAHSKHALSVRVVIGDLKITLRQKQQHGFILPTAPVTAEPNKGLI